MENEVMNIVLTDEEGVETEFEVITKLDIEEKEYVIVVPVDAEGEVDAVALRIEKDESGEDILVTIDDEDEFEMVSEAYETLFLNEDIH